MTIQKGVKKESEIPVKLVRVKRKPPRVKNKDCNNIAIR